MAIIGAVMTMVSIMMTICCTWLRSREDRAAQVPPEAGRHLRRVIAAGDRAQGGNHRHQKHQAADLENGARVAPDDAAVDDIRRQSRQPQIPERLREGQREYQYDRAAMGSQKARQAEHGGTPVRECGEPDPTKVSGHSIS
jgi:hypothetical protein